MQQQHAELFETTYQPDVYDETAYRDMLREELVKNWTGGFCRMPDAVRNDRNLSPKAKIVYEQLLAHMWFSTDHCWPSQQTIADETGYSRRTVIRATKELYERGYIEKWRRGQGHSNYYFINPLSFPRSFCRTSRGRAETMILDVHAPERLEVCEEGKAKLFVPLTMSQSGTSARDKVSHPEVTAWHPKQTKENQIQGKERDSNASTSAQKGTDFPVVTQATRNEHKETRYAIGKQEEGKLQSGREHNDNPVPPSKKPNNSPSSYGTQGTATPVRAKDAKYDKFAQQQTKQAAIAALTGIPEQHLEEMGSVQGKQRRPIPEFLRDIISRYSRELGDSTSSTKSNITRAAKLYFFALDYIKDAQDDPQGFFNELLYEAKQAAYKVNGIRYRSASNRPNRMPVFFTCLENLFELRDEELVYIRSDEPLLEP